MEYDDQRRLYSINIGDPNSLGLTCISSAPPHGGASIPIPQQTISADHARLLVGSLLDASVVTISPQITTHSQQQPVHHVLHQHQSQQTHLQHQQDNIHHHLSNQQIAAHQVDIEANHASLQSQMAENHRVIIDSNNMYVVGQIGEELLRQDSSGTISIVNDTGPDASRCFVCNEPFTGTKSDIVDAANTILTASRRKLSSVVTRLVGVGICSMLGTEMCLPCFYLVQKVDSLEMELANAKIDVIRKCEETLECRLPGNKFPITWPSLEGGNDDVESEEVYESPNENMDDDPNDPDVTPSTLSQSRKKKTKRKLPIKKNSASSSILSKKHLKTGAKRGRGRPKKKEKIEESFLPEGTLAKPCPCCHKEVELEGYLRHLGTHKVFPCPFCMTVYKRKDIKNHIAESHQEEPEYPCSGCELTFDTFSRLRRHCTSIHMGIELERTQCSICSKSFSSSNGLKVHVETIHDNAHVFECPVCKESFNQRGNMKNHYKRVHEGEESRKLQCDVCNKGFICPSDLRKHVERVHLKIKKNEVMCRLCSKLFSDPRALKVHVNAVHTREVKFPCPDCKMVFHSLTNMVTHRRRMHGGNGGRRHLCEICSKAFCSPSDLRTHVKVVHENLRKYVCDICGQSFKVGSHLKYHRRRHTGETPYKCPHCGKCFHGPSHISDHVKKVHKTVYLGINQRRRLNIPDDAPPPPPGILPSRDSKAKLTLAPPQNDPPSMLTGPAIAASSQVVIPQAMQSQQLSTSISTSMQHMPQHIIPFGGQSSHMISGPTMMDQHVVHHGHYTNIQFDQMNTQSPMPMVVRLLHDMQY